MVTTINYTSALESRLRNVANLAHGTGCNYLVCINGENGELVAKQWLRKKPTVAKFQPNETLVVFGAAKRKPRRRSAMDIAAEACGLIKVRGAVSGRVYYE